MSEEKDDKWLKFFDKASDESTSRVLTEKLELLRRPKFLVMKFSTTIKTRFQIYL